MAQGIWVTRGTTGTSGGEDVQSAHDLVGERFDLSTDLITQLRGNADGYYDDSVVAQLDNLQDVIDSLEVPSTATTEVSAPEVPDIDFTGRPAFGELTIPDEFPDAPPTAPVLNEVPDIDSVTIPVISISQPEWNNPVRPELDTLTPPPDDLPDIVDPDIPQPPSIAMPDAPVIQDIVIPGPPNIDIPTFDATMVDQAINMPSGFSWSESEYNSDIWNGLLEKVRDGIENGGTGLGEEIEQAIWDRAQNRLDVENDNNLRQIEDYWAAKNHPMPPGEMSGALLELYSSITRANEDLTRDIAIEQARLAQDYQKHVVERGIDLEQVLRGFHDAQMNRGFEAAKTIAANGIEIYNAQIQLEGLVIERYKARAVVYSEQVKAALTGVEIYKAQIDGLKVSAEVQKTLVDIYDTQVRAVETAAKVYNAQMEGARIQSEINQVRLQSYEVATRVYLARVEAQKAEYEIYRIDAEVEKTRAQIYAEQVRAYLAEVEATKVQADVNLANLEAALRENTMLIDAYKSELAGYQAEVNAAAVQVNATVEGFKGEVAAYSAETDAQGMEYGARVKELEVKIKEAEFQLRRALGEIEATTQGYLGVKELEVKGAEGMLNVVAQLLAAALNAVNASASLGATSSVNESDSSSLVESLSESHTYDHE